MGRINNNLEVLSDARFADFFKKYPLKTVAESLRVSESTVSRRARRLGILKEIPDRLDPRVIPGGLPQK